MELTLLLFLTVSQTHSSNLHLATRIFTFQRNHSSVCHSSQPRHNGVHQISQPIQDAQIALKVVIQPIIELAKVLQKNKICVLCIYKEIYDKELDHIVIKAGKSQICSVGSKTGEPGELITQMQSEGSRLKFPLLWKAYLLVSLRSFQLIGWNLST